LETKRERVLRQRQQRSGSFTIIGGLLFKYFILINEIEKSPADVFATIIGTTLK